MDIIFFLITTVVPFLVNLFLVALGGFVIVLLCRQARRFSVDRLRYERSFEDICVYEGDSTVLTETIWNPTLFIVPFADIGSYFYGGLSVDGKQAEKGMSLFISRYHLLPFERVTRKLRVECVKRGCYRLTSVFISRLGEERYIEAPAEIFVYPRVEPIAEDVKSAYGIGDVLSRRKLILDPFTVNGVREYQPGDSFHTINFKASARLSSGGNPRFMVNRYEYCATFKYYIYQNFHIPKEGDLLFDVYEQLMEDGLRFSASLAVKALDAGGVCAFGANCATVDGKLKVEFPLRGGDVHKNDVLREMSMIRAMDGASFASILAADIAKGISNAEVFIVTSYVDETLSGQIAALEYMGNTVRVIMLRGN